MTIKETPVTNPSPTTYTAPLVFLDTETTGLGLEDPIWEIGLIRRETDGAETVHHFFVEHDPSAAGQLPEKYRADHDTRYGAAELVWAPDQLWVVLAYLLRPCPETGARAHVVGCCPWFDTTRISLQLLAEDEPWHHHLIDVEAMAFAGLTRRPATNRPAVPWVPDQMFADLGLDLDRYPRHTALGDARLARDVFDTITATSPAPSVAA